MIAALMPPKTARAASVTRPLAVSSAPPKGGLRVLSNRVPVLVLCTWLLLYASRPFYLGFFSDDWDLLGENLQGTWPFSLARFFRFIGIHTAYAARPVAGIIGFLISSIAGGSPIAYQVICALLALMAALSLRGWLKSLLPEVSKAHPFAADLAAAAWLSFPWSVAATGFATCAIAALPAQIFFTEAARLMAAREGRDRKRLFHSGALLLASYLTYETFYFQGILLAAFYWVRARRDSGPWRHRLILTVCIVQGASFALNRSVGYLNPSTSKKFAPLWRTYTWAALNFSQYSVPAELLRSAASLGTLWSVLFTVILLAAIASVVVLLLKSGALRLLGSLGAIALSLLSIPVFCVIYALAGYQISFDGLMSRTLNGISWAVAVLLYGLLSVILLSNRRAIAVPGAIAALLFVVVSGMAQQLHVSEFATVWQEEKAILARAPIKEIKSLPKESQTNILYIGPSYHKDLPIFGAVWELTGAVFSLPELRGWQRPNQRSVHIHPAGTYNWSWDGSALIQELPGYWKQEFAGKAFYVWEYDEGSLIQTQAGFHWDGRNTALNSLRPSAPTMPPAATFLKIDTQTQGNWIGAYGADGLVIPFDPPGNPAYAEVKFADANLIVWAPSTENVRAPESQVTADEWWTSLLRLWLTEDRKISCWWSASGFTIDVNLVDGQTHQIALYLVDWDSGGLRVERIDALDADSGAVLDTRTISSFSKGQYLVWNLRGHVVLRVTPTAGANGVASALFFH
jgi:hypothetical protein